MKSCKAMKKKKFIPTRRKRLKDKQLADTITIKLLSMIDELHNAKGSVVSIPGFIKNLKNKNV